MLSPLPALLLLAALVLPTAATTNSTRVIGGRPCTPRSQPWQVALFKDMRLRCGGTLIHPQWVLSAAHCYVQGLMMVRLGEYDLGHLDGTEQFRLASRLVRHPGYNHTTKEHDLMLVQLRRPANLGPAVRTLPLGTRCPAPGTPCLVSGWGTTTSPQGTKPNSGVGAQNGGWGPWGWGSLWMHVVGLTLKWGIWAQSGGGDYGDGGLCGCMSMG
ncbi:kallikrein-15-like [Oxyura jamaicensis]|uniref:kallikrein-15-like n=1 Tax=Oxyura jamaicensis TaxID=8884 RepID=UPI0015A722F6|nr:kallikrein-15-like [Oxyura jamaicensis]